MQTLWPKDDEADELDLLRFGETRWLIYVFAATQVVMLLIFWRLVQAEDSGATGCIAISCTCMCAQALLRHVVEKVLRRRKVDVLDHSVRLELRCPVAVLADDGADEWSLPAAPEDHTPTSASSSRSELSPLTIAPSGLHAGSAPLPAGLVFVFVDDDIMPRIHAEMFIRVARGDTARSLILGETHDEVVALPARLARMGAEVGQTNIVCLLDQNLCYDQGLLLGTDICRALRADGWGGLIIIHSANDEPAAVRSYLASGADGCIGKSAKGGVAEMCSKLAAAYHERARRCEWRMGAGGE